jgi:hypothetical protein
MNWWGGDMNSFQLSVNVWSSTKSTAITSEIHELIKFEMCVWFLRATIIRPRNPTQAPVSEQTCDFDSLGKIAWKSWKNGLNWKMFGIDWVYAGNEGTELQCLTFQWLKIWRSRKKLFLSKNQNDSTIQTSDHLNHHDLQYFDKHKQETRNQMKIGVRSLSGFESINFVIDQKCWRVREVWWLKLWRRVSFISWKEKRSAILN